MTHSPIPQLLSAAIASTLLGCVGTTVHKPPQPAKTAAPASFDDVRSDALYRRGMLLAGTGDLVRAEQYLSAAIERGYPADKALAALLSVCVRAGRLRRALIHAEARMLNQPDARHLRLLIAHIALALGQRHRAHHELVRLTSAGTGSAQAHYLLGTVFCDRLPSLEAAHAHLRAYLRLAPRGKYVADARARLGSPDLLCERNEGTGHASTESPI
ncbi:MAG: hypothetical protein MJD61_06735 [Proteobacteria bacterium]|nr:hypothetical protein [Pseudomonadota bacterium]